ncbi:hypothetical protein F5Y16DRAFT_213243 [Xylariaceae sp. FL0255]|nr:hypothetical protein F5Y16DRAFT_213243 [Xylariaceae sp. FL0255]
MAPRSQPNRARGNDADRAEARHITDVRRRKRLRDITYKIIPGCCVIIIVFSIGAILVATLAYNKPIPHVATIVISSLLLAFFSLFCMSAFYLYSKKYDVHDFEHPDFSGRTRRLSCDGKSGLKRLAGTIARPFTRYGIQGASPSRAQPNENDRLEGQAPSPHSFRVLNARAEDRGPSRPREVREPISELETPERYGNQNESLNRISHPSQRLPQTPGERRSPQHPRSTNTRRLDVASITPPDPAQAPSHIPDSPTQNAPRRSVEDMHSFKNAARKSRTIPRGAPLIRASSKPLPRLNTDDRSRLPSQSVYQQPPSSQRSPQLVQTPTRASHERNSVGQPSPITPTGNNSTTIDPSNQIDTYRVFGLSAQSSQLEEGTRQTRPADGDETNSNGKMSSNGPYANQEYEHGYVPFQTPDHGTKGVLKRPKNSQNTSSSAKDSIDRNRSVHFFDTPEEFEGDIPTRAKFASQTQKAMGRSLTDQYSQSNPQTPFYQTRPDLNGIPDWQPTSQLPSGFSPEPGPSSQPQAQDPTHNPQENAILTQPCPEIPQFPQSDNQSLIFENESAIPKPLQPSKTKPQQIIPDLPDDRRDPFDLLALPDDLLSNEELELKRMWEMKMGLYTDSEKKAGLNAKQVIHQAKRTTEDLGEMSMQHEENQDKGKGKALASAQGQRQGGPVIPRRESSWTFAPASSSAIPPLETPTRGRTRNRPERVSIS